MVVRTDDERFVRTVDPDETQRGLSADGGWFGARALPLTAARGAPPHRVAFRR